jgi:DNA-binding beta-propeller fold protein YncE
MDLGEKTFSQFIPKGRGQLKTPTNCWVDSQGTLYVADPGRRQIVIFDTLGQYVDAFGDTPKSKPTDVTVYDNRIWVPDAAQNRVNVYGQSDRKLIFSFPDSTITDEGHLYQPINICVANDVVYVTDFGDFKVKSYTLKGEFITAVGGFGNAFGQLARPKGIAVDREDNLFVVDAAFENVQIFNKKNQLLMFFGGTYKGPGGMYLPAKVLVDYNNLDHYQKFVDPAFKLKYLIYVTNQYGPDKINVYGAVDIKK